MIGRPKSYIEADVLDAVMEVFWDQGFAVTSYDDLVKATGLGRQSLYNGFGDKKELFFRSINHYTSKVTSQSIAVLRKEGPVLENIRQWLTRLKKKLVEHRKGCLLTNSAVELPFGESTGKLVLGELDQVEKALSDLLHRAIAEQVLVESTDVSSLSFFLLGIAQGLMVLGKAGAAEEKLQTLVDTSINHLLQYSVQN